MSDFERNAIILNKTSVDYFIYYVFTAVESSNRGLNSPSFGVSLKQCLLPLIAPTSPANRIAQASPFLSSRGCVHCFLFKVQVLSTYCFSSFYLSQSFGFIYCCAGSYSDSYSTWSRRSRTGPGTGSRPRPRRLFSCRHHDTRFLG